MEEYGEIIDSSSSTEESDDEELPTNRYRTPTFIVGSHVVEIQDRNAAPFPGNAAVAGAPFTHFHQPRPLFVEMLNPNVGSMPAGVENAGNCFPQSTTISTQELLAQAAQRLAMANQAYHQNPPMRAENNNSSSSNNNNNGRPTITWPPSPWIGYPNDGSVHPQAGYTTRVSFVRTTVPTDNPYIPLMPPYQMEQQQPMSQSQPESQPQQYVMAQISTNPPILYQVEASTARPTTRTIRNSVYDPAYERMGLPLDPHIRAFLASSFNNNADGSNSNSASKS